MSNKPRVLLVEDDKLEAEVTALHLRQLGYTLAAIAETGETAIKAAAEYHPDLVLMDIQLAGDMDGVQAAAAIHKRFDIPVIYLTAYADDQLLKRTGPTDATGYIVKPYTERELAAVLSTALYKAASVRQLKEAALLSNTLMSICDGLISTDIDGRIKIINPSACSLTGWDEKAAIGKPVSDIIKLKTENNIVLEDDLVSMAMAKNDIIRPNEFLFLQNKNEAFTPVFVGASPILNEQGVMHGGIMMIRDMTEYRRLENKLAHQASHDPLTELTNRREFEKRLMETLHDVHQNPKTHALCYLDLDQFKVVNDTCGHGAGDRLLRQLTSELQLHIRDGDTFARLGGDEFGIILQNCSIKKATRIAKEIIETIKQFRFIWDKKIFEIGASIGLIAINADSVALSEIMSRVDSACYVAKEKGRNNIHIYKANDFSIAKRHREMEWVNQITRALEDKSLVLYCQKSRRLNGAAKNSFDYCELLLRIVDKNNKVHSASHFIPAAERYQLMPTIDRWVIQATLEHLSPKTKLFDPSIIYAINLSGQSFGDEAFINFVLHQFKLHGAQPKNYCFEITETAAITDISHALHFIKALKSIGCRFALDDFGSGLSSFSYLKTLPVDFLKIDGRFIRTVADDPIDHAFVAAINQLGHVMGVQTIAECVESNLVLETLRGLEVDFAQGWEVGSPEPLATFSPTQETSHPPHSLN